MWRTGLLAALSLVLFGALPAAADWPLPRPKPATTRTDPALAAKTSVADRDRADPGEREQADAPSPAPDGGDAEAPEGSEDVGARACVARLEARGAQAEPAEQPSTVAECTIDTPVRLKAVATGEKPIPLSAPVVVDCRLAEVFADWVSDIAEPLAHHHLGRGLARLAVGTGHECRTRNRDPGAKLSAHATGLGLDLSGFALEGSGTVSFRTELLAETHVHYRFYRALRTTACGAFTTVLGPGSDAAHADHLHVDVIRRGRGDERSGHRICQ